jgi:hypothetical protein
MSDITIYKGAVVVVGFTTTYGFSGGRSRREPSTMGKQLVNFITLIRE